MKAVILGRMTYNCMRGGEVYTNEMQRVAEVRVNRLRTASFDLDGVDVEAVNGEDGLGFAEVVSANVNGDFAFFAG